MTYFAIGESTGGAGERRLGPFDTPEEAAQAGRKETRESNGGFVFRGVVDEANNQVGFDIEPIVSTNSVVRNAMATKNRVARNAEALYERFSPSVKGEIEKGNSPHWFIEISTDGLIAPWSQKSASECIAKCEAVIRNLDEKKQGLVKAIAWLKKNA